MIRSFACKDTEALFGGSAVARFRNLRKAAERKLLMLDAATTVGDLRAPPGNCLERLTGDRAGHYSIRINDQFRLCFRWGDYGPEAVEIVDYH